MFKVNTCSREIFGTIRLDCHVRYGIICQRNLAQIRVSPVPREVALAVDCDENALNRGSIHKIKSLSWQQKRLEKGLSPNHIVIWWYMHTYPCEIKENHFSLRSPLHIYLFWSRFSHKLILSFSIKTPWVSYTNFDRLCFRSFYQMVNIFNPCLTEKYIHQIHQILNYIKKLLNTCLHLNGRRDDLDPQSSHNLFMYLE